MAVYSHSIRKQEEGSMGDKVPSSYELVHRFKGRCVWSVAGTQCGRTLDRLALWRATTDAFEYCCWCGKPIGSPDEQ